MTAAADVDAVDVDDAAAITARKCARDVAHPISGAHVSKNASASVIGGGADDDDDDDEEDVEDEDDDERSNADDDRDSNRRPPPPL